ncbi:ABC transporter substrate-binding protein [Streptococcus caprae]|uniref:ABC transporter substrate-binding protein n=1 Tax=Streptococcus caprae TaxID=1640501 RepID=A0ABV8CTQ5_9STRE
MLKLFKNHMAPVGLVLIIVALLGSAYFADTREHVVLELGLYADSSWDVPQGQQYQWIDRVIADFENQHPGVEVVYESGILKKDYSNWLANKIVSGKAPDAFMILEKDFNVLASTDALVNLNNRVASDLDTSLFFPVALEAGRFGSQQFGLPVESNPVMICVNTDLLAKEGISVPQSGWTLQEFYKICQQVTKDTDGNGVLDQFGFTDYTWQQALLAYGQPLFDRSGQSVFLNTDQSKEALDFMTKLQELNGNYKVTTEDFDAGKVAFFPMTLAQYRTYRPYPYHISKYSSFAWTCIKMPAQTSNINATPVETSLVGISSKTSHRQLAWELMMLLSSNTKSQQTLVQQSQGISVLQSVMASDETAQILNTDNVVSEALTTATIQSMMADAVAEPRFKNYQALLKKADYLISQSLEQGTIETDLIRIQKELEQE